MGVSRSDRAGTGRDLVAILEAAYQPAPTLRSWLRGVIEAFRISYFGNDTVAGCYGYVFRRDETGFVRCSTDVVVGLPARYRTYLRATMAVEDREFQQLMYNCPPCSTLSQLVPTQSGRAQFLRSPFLNDAMATESLNDQVGFRAEDGSGHGIIIGAPLKRLTRLERRDVATMMRILAHVAAGYRIRRKRTLSDPLAEAEAVFSTRGRLLHAHASLQARADRTPIEEAAKARLVAEGSLRRDNPSEAIEVWRALVEGQWSIIEHFDHDGRRYLITRRNAPKAMSARALSRREAQIVALVALGHSNKLIAYELGLRVSTVSAYLSSACKKLGATSRVELVKAARHLGGS